MSKELFDEDFKVPTDKKTTFAPFVILGVVIVVVVGVVGAIWGFDYFAEEPNLGRLIDMDKELQKIASEEPTDTPYYVSGMIRPKQSPASAATFADDTKMLGIKVGDIKRAYPYDYFKEWSSRIINDMFGEVPISIICSPAESSKVLRVFTHDRPQLIRIDMGGWMEGKMFVRYRGQQRFAHDEFPGLDEYKDHELTTWGEWKKRHPDTTVFLGNYVPDEEARSMMDELQETTSDLEAKNLPTGDKEPTTKEAKKK